MESDVVHIGVMIKRTMFIIFSPSTVDKSVATRGCLSRGCEFEAQTNWNIAEKRRLAPNQSINKLIIFHSTTTVYNDFNYTDNIDDTNNTNHK